MNIISFKWYLEIYQKSSYVTHWFLTKSNDKLYLFKARLKLSGFKILCIFTYSLNHSI
jgi:hypothetical protein